MTWRSGSPNAEMEVRLRPVTSTPASPRGRRPVARTLKPDRVGLAAHGNAGHQRPLWRITLAFDHARRQASRCCLTRRELTSARCATGESQSSGRIRDTRPTAGQQCISCAPLKPGVCVIVEWLWIWIYGFRRRKSPWNSWNACHLSGVTEGAFVVVTSRTRDTSYALERCSNCSNSVARRCSELPAPFSWNGDRPK